MVKVWSSEPIQNTSEDENNLTHENESLNDKFLHEFSKLHSYVYEPRISKASMKDAYLEKESSDPGKEKRRIESTLWFTCGKCWPIATHGESFCYQEKRNSWKLFLSFILTRFENVFPLILRKCKLNYSEPFLALSCLKWSFLWHYVTAENCHLMSQRAPS